MTIFAEMSALAARIGAVNLGQGFPDEDGPAAMLKTAENAIAEGVNQYPPGPGIAPLRQAIAAQRQRHYGITYDPDTEVLVTVGATEAIAASVIGLVEPGSEVLLIEPFYDSYSPVIAMAGCHRVAVPLVTDGRGFAIDVDALRGAVTPRTRALIVNSPHNPTGMVATDAELAAIAALAVEHDLLVITDEVYEQLVFDGHRHLPLAGYPGMAERTITISSAAKMFNVTGWKIGWACGPADLIAGVRAAKQFLTYVGGAPFQPAVAQALDNEDAWVAALRESFQAKRNSARRRAHRHRLRRARQLRHLLPVRRPASAGLRRQHHVLRRATRAGRRRGHPDVGVLRSRLRRTSATGITWCASPSASATTPWKRRSRGCRCSRPSRDSRASDRRCDLPEMFGVGRVRAHRTQDQIGGARIEVALQLVAHRVGRTDGGEVDRPVGLLACDHRGVGRNGLVERQFLCGEGCRQPRRRRTPRPAPRR